MSTSAEPMANSHKGGGLDGSDESGSSDSEKTQVVRGWFEDRIPDLSDHVPREERKSPPSRVSSLQNQKQKFKTPESDPPGDIMAQQYSQLTQPYENPRRLGRHVSDISEGDLADVICILHPNSPAAFEAVQATMLAAPQHILQNDDLDGIAQDDIDLNPNYSSGREFALRISSSVKKPANGFTFGRSKDHTDILLVKDDNDKAVSNVHFRIFVNQQGSLMVQDMSTNGTVVDDDQLRCKDRYGRPTPKASTLALKNGSIICLTGPGKAEIKLMLRIPHRGDFEDTYEANLKKYLSARGQVPLFSSMRESAYGNHWNGGSLYNFTGLLGKGAFATVYKVQTKKDGNVYAAKELDKRKFIKNGILDVKFDSELKIMEGLQHPNIVQYVDCHTHDQYVYIIMENVPYGELSREVEKYGSLPEPVVQNITVQILTALKYLHRRNIVHRDIKPDNILIASRDPLIVKLSDFGLSKCVKNQETFLKTFCGTLLYCAPEIYPDYGNYARGHTQKRRRLGDLSPRPSLYDQSVDMWSFGAVLFHILCGRAPIMGRGDDRGAQMLANIMTKNVDFSPLRQRKLSENAIDFIGRLMSRDPHLRPKEDECFNHPWIKDIKYPLDYTDEASQADVRAVQQKLEVAEEEFDLDEEELAAYDALRDLEQITTVPRDMAIDDYARPPKKPKTLEITTDVPYPLLPSLRTESPAVHGQTELLFGEIGPTMQSSGALGNVHTIPMVQTLRNRVEQISVNDFVSVNPTLEDEPMAEAPGSAASLLGAETHFGHLQMASPIAVSEEASSPDTTNPITPHTRDVSPSEMPVTDYEPTISAEEGEVRHPIFDRRIDLDLITDHESFAKEVALRNASRAQKKGGKAATFQATGNPRESPLELARTIDARTGESVQSINTSTERLTTPMDRTLQLNGEKFVKPSHEYATLTSTPGSCASIIVHAKDRLTSWGRGLECTVQYPDKQDVRIPKMAIKLIFWAPGVEDIVAKGRDWTTIPGIRTIISTSASRSIWINGVELRKEAPDGGAALFGKLYTGDMITIFEDPKTGSYLKFEAEVLFGDSARRRPEVEKGFQIEKEVVHYQRMKERESMRSQAANPVPESGR